LSKFRYSLGFLLWLGVISYLSLTPSSPVSSPVEGLDKVVHFIFYLVLTWLLGKGLMEEWSIKGILFWLIIIFVPVCIGIVIEMIQSTVPGRTRENMDVVFNVLGTFLALIPFVKRLD
jgi:VanZ family protein